MGELFAMSGTPHLEFEKVLNKCLAIGVEYINHQFKEFNGKDKWVITFKCNDHGSFETSWDSFRALRNCTVCRKENNLILEREKYFNEFIEIIKEKEATFISGEYINAHSKLIVYCKNNHFYETCLNNLKNGHWCKKCNFENSRYTIEEIKKIANEKGGECLSNEYSGNYKDILIWKCAKGHVWKNSLYNVNNHNTWCQECRKEGFKKEENKVNYNKVNKLSWKYIESIVRYRSGQILVFNKASPPTINMRLKIKCGNGHIFDRSIDDLIYSDDRWCRECNIKKFKLYEYYKVKVIALERGYTLLSKPTDYFDQTTILKYICPNGHPWECSSANFKRDRNCRECNLINRRIRADILLEVAESRGGKLLTPIEQYKNSKQLLMWECNKGHQFTMTSETAISWESWCPNCTGKWQSELKCKYIVEEFTRLKFFKNRTILNSNFEGIENFLELDMFNDELKLALEYNGEQHYRFVDLFQKDYAEFEEQLRRDKLKVSICKEIGIKLIVIPYTYANDSDKINYIKEQLIIHNVPIVNSEVSMKNFYKGSI